MTHRTSCLLLLAALSGCYREDLPIYDLRGKIILPREAATQRISIPVDENGDPISHPDEAVGFTEKVVPPDVRMIGPVYVGLYPSITYDFRNYPHPEVAFGVDTYPYGGTTVGDFRFACVQFFQCKMVSGRFVDYDDIVEFFNRVLVNPITDARGEVIEAGEYIRQSCFDLLNITSDGEIRITAYEDRNGDGVLDRFDLDFVETPDGDFVAEFIIPQAEFYEGMTAWAFMDAPDGRGYDFATCNEQLGRSITEYDQNYRAGAAERDVLNRPYLYLDNHVEDWVSSRGFVWNSPFEEAEIVLDFHVGTDDIGMFRVEEAE